MIFGIPNIQGEQLSDTLTSVVTYLRTSVLAVEIISSFKVRGRDTSSSPIVIKFHSPPLSGINGLPWLIDWGLERPPSSIPGLQPIYLFASNLLWQKGKSITRPEILQGRTASDICGWAAVLLIFTLVTVLARSDISPPSPSTSLPTLTTPYRCYPQSRSLLLSLLSFLLSADLTVT